MHARASQPLVVGVIYCCRPALARSAPSSIHFCLWLRAAAEAGLVFSSGKRLITSENFSLLKLPPPNVWNKNCASPRLLLSDDSLAPNSQTPVRSHAPAPTNDCAVSFIGASFAGFRLCSSSRLF